MKRFSKILTLASLLFASLNINAQTTNLTAQLDSMTIFIGGQVGLNISASFPESMNVQLNQLADTLTKEIEIVETLPIDTTINNGIVTLMQRYIITSFDTGLFYIPPIEMLNLPDGSTKSTDYIALMVVNPFQSIEVDPQNGIARITDIREPFNAEFILAELLQYWPWLVGALLLIGSIIGIRYWYKHIYVKAEKPKKQKPTEPCEVTALRDLERIREEKLWQRNLFKEYYSDITDTLRKYICSRYNVNAMESTSDEILDALREPLANDNDDKKRIESVLATADLVKFAKHEPLPDENDMAIKHAIEFVNGTTIKLEVKVTENTEEIVKTEEK